MNIVALPLAILIEISKGGIEELIMDIKKIADNKNNSSKKSFNNNLSALTITNNATNYKWGFPLQNHDTSATIIDKLNIVHKKILSYNRVLKYIRADVQFVTSRGRAIASKRTRARSCHMNKIKSCTYD